MILLGVTLTCAHGALSVGAVACFLLALLEAASGAAAGVAKRVVVLWRGLNARRRRRHCVGDLPRLPASRN